MTEELPRLIPTAIDRPALVARLRGDVEVPLRLLLAPAGSGKTTLAVAYARAAGGGIRYLALPPACDAATLRELLVATGEHASEIIIDDLDNAAPDAVALLRERIGDPCIRSHDIYVTRSIGALDIRREVAQGLVSILDATDLAFHAPDVRALAQRYGTPYTHADIARLLAATDGWAIAVAGVIRRAALDGRSLENAFECWRKRDALTLQAFVERELEAASEEDRRAFALALSGATLDTGQRLRRLCERGLFVRPSSGGYRVYTALLMMETGRYQDIGVTDDLPLSVQVFGSFHAAIGAQAIAWVRKRDAQIIKYLLLGNGMRATRKELLAAFWPETDPHLAQQSLRTACSNIRKALATVVGYDRVDAYVRVTATDVALDPERVTTDARTFAGHVYAADSAYQRGNLDEAIRQYENARALYASPLLAGDAEEPWMLPAREHYDELFVVALERLAELSAERGETRQAREYVDEILRVRPNNSIARRLLVASPPAPREVGIERRRLLLA